MFPKNMMFALRFGATLVCAWSAAGFSQAEAAEDLASLSGVVQQQAVQAEEFRKETEARAPEGPAPAPAAPQTADETLEPAGESGPLFLVNRILFEGNTVFPSSEFDPYVSVYEGQTVSLESLQLAAKAVTTHYRTRGYLTSRAYIKPQKIENGVVTIQVLEGKLDRTVVDGNKHFPGRLFEEAVDMPQDGPFRYSDLERRLRFLNRNPDYKIGAVLAPGQKPETSDLHLRVDDRFPMHAYYEFNNRGTKLTHRARHLVTGVHNNFLGRSDTFALTAAVAEEEAFRALSASWSLPLWDTGTTFLLSGSTVRSRLVKHLEPLDIGGAYGSITPAISQELMATQNALVSWYAGLEIKDSKSTVGGDKTSYDRMRVLVTGPRWSRLHSNGRTSAAAEVHRGIPDFLGGSEAGDPNASRAGSGGDFVYYTASASRIQRLPHGLMGTLRGEGQWSDDTLTSVELMRLGGNSSVRGYPESDSQGDYGFAGNLELGSRMPVPDSWKVPFTAEAINQSVEWIGFFDAGKVFSHERTNRMEAKDRMLMGAGTGLKFRLKENLVAQFHYGWPLGDRSTDNDRPQAHFSIHVGL